jgi:hypothetical protein
LHVGIGSLWQYPAANGDGGVACDNNLSSTPRNCNRLFLGHAQRIDTRNLSLAGCFVNIWGRDARRCNA